jgi:16S rRNA (guanine1516-N2)-methyltransferase
VRCGVPYFPRTGPLSALWERTDLLYVVQRDHELLRDRNERIRVTKGLLKARLHGAGNHPLVRAIVGDGLRIGHIHDATMGLALDSMHLSGATGARVTGSEASSLVFSLLEAGLPDLGREPSMTDLVARIQPKLGHARTHLEAMEAGSLDAVLLAPMYAEPRSAPPGYAVFRKAAEHAPLDRETIEAARRAARRVVLKVDRGQPPAEAWPIEDDTVITGRSVDYRVLCS